MPFLSEGLVAAVAVIVFVFIHLMLWSKVAELKGDIDLLERQLKDKANKWELELTDRTKQLHNEKLEALEVHLGIRFFETPKRLVVKNILEK
jgi:hypothetical protein